MGRESESESEREGERVALQIPLLGVVLSSVIPQGEHGTISVCVCGRRAYNVAARNKGERTRYQISRSRSDLVELTPVGVRREMRI